MHYLKEVFASRELLANLMMREIRGKYKRTVFGQLWSLANPLALMLIYTFVFAFISADRARSRGPERPGYLRAVAALRTLALDVFRNGCLARARIDRRERPTDSEGLFQPNRLAAVSGRVHRVQLAVRDGRPSGCPQLPSAPSCCPGFHCCCVIMVLLAIFAAGIALMLSIANVYFRDTEYFLGIVLATVDVPDPDHLSGLAGRNGVGEVGRSVRHIASPLRTSTTSTRMEHFVNVFRQLLYDNRWPDPSGVAHLRLLGARILRRRNLRVPTQ